MADNALTQGQPSGAGENSSSPPQTYQAQQDALQRSEHAAVAAQDAAKLAAATAAKGRVASKRMTPSLDAGDWPGGLTVTSAPKQATRRIGGKKG